MRFRFTRQFDQMDCGPACVRMVVNHYGKDYPLSYLRTQAYLSREGVSVAGIRHSLADVGMESASFEMTIAQLRDKCPLPAILHWEQNHFVVLYEVVRSPFTNEWRYRIANPAYGKHTFSEEELAKHWLNGDKGVVIAIEPTEEFYKRESVREEHSFIKFARRYVWPFKREIGQLMFGMLSGMLLSLISPFLTQAMVDNGIGMRDMNVIATLMFAQLFLFLGSFTMGLISNWVTLYMGTRININVLRDYLSKLLRLPMTFFETKSIGDYQQRIGDHGRLQGFTTQATIQTLFSIVSAVVLLAIIGFYDWVILVAYLSLTGLSTLWMSYFWKRRKSLDYEQFRISSKNQNKLYELMSGITDIKLNGYSDYKLDEWNGMQEELYRMSQKSLRLGQIQNTGYTMIGQVRNILITFWIAAEVVEGNLTLGMMMSITNIIGQVNGPLSNLIGFLQRYQDAKISLERSEEVYLCENEDAEVTRSIPDYPCCIDVVGLTYSYTGTIGKPALDDVNFTIPARKMTAIVGESGSGKSTLMKLLLKFYTPTSGMIAWGDYDARDYTAASIRKQTGIVMQDNFVFSDTIKQNIILGEPYDEERLNRAIDMACLREYVDSLPLGIHTRIGTEGNGVSGGERQRIMIARAIYKRPLYLMLDEATSSLDADNEARITENINREFQGRTRIVIAHRLSTVKNADNIVVLRSGKVVEQGTHRELVEQKGYYYELVKNQLELAE